jgi:hypothetical protein
MRLFGMNGNGQEQPAAPETSSLWGDMFGMGSLFKMISDPGLMAHTHAMMAAVIEGANANRRIEAKLDRLLNALGHQINDINARFPAGFQPPGAPGAPVLLEGNGAYGGGSPPPSGGVADGGTGGDPAELGADRFPVAPDRGGSGAS